MSELMRAGVATKNGVEIREIARPTAGPAQLLVRVLAAGINRADLDAARRVGVANAISQPIGMEWAGEIVCVGSDVTDLKVGDLVMASGGGGYAEYAVSDVGRTIKLDGVDMRKAAALPLALMTAHDAVVTNGRFERHETVLVQGASSAVGLVALQITRLLGGATIIGTSSNAGRRARLADFGATIALDAAGSDWTDKVLEATGKKGVDLVVDMVSGATVNQSMSVTAIRGRIVNVGRLGGSRSEFDFDLHAARRLNLIGVTFRTRSKAEIHEIVRRMHEDLWGAVKAGELDLPIDRCFALDEAKAAHTYMTTNAHFGKIVLIP